MNISSRLQKNLKEALGRNEVNPAEFNDVQLKDIAAEKKQITGFTWHHHQDYSRMQLVPQKIHGDVRHIGGVAISK